MDLTLHYWWWTVAGTSRTTYRWLTLTILCILHVYSESVGGSSCQYDQFLAVVWPCTQWGGTVGSTHTVWTEVPGSILNSVLSQETMHVYSIMFFFLVIEILRPSCLIWIYRWSNCLIYRYVVGILGVNVLRSALSSGGYFPYFTVVSHPHQLYVLVPLHI